CPMCLAAVYWARIDKLYFAAGREDAADAGFDDELIYTEVSKAWKLRELPAEQILTDEARKAFEAWKVKEDRTAY
ncbi:MAG TPA: tRNA-specific adenosine deaminase, partial [Tichowtungia sp.]|nr:tRNA-specific adenosine deaminase [Tichowtungia sp.]